MEEKILHKCSDGTVVLVLTDGTVIVRTATGVEIVNYPVLTLTT